MAGKMVSPTSELTCCIAEDRASCEPALRILLASLKRHNPHVPVVLFCPNASVEFSHWVATLEGCQLNPWPLDGPWTKYDIKPLALLTGLRAGLTNLLWIDSDIVITRNIEQFFNGLDNSCITVTEEALGGGRADPGALRARLWNFAIGRELPFTVNTAVLRVSSEHIGLLEAWNNLLQSREYRTAQAAPWYERPCHLAGDQEVLTALLSSAQFAGIPICYLRRGKHIIQFFGSSGYTVVERIGNLVGGRPFFIHSQGLRPWWPDSPIETKKRGTGFVRLYNALSPYLIEARSYASCLPDPSWLEPPTRTARFLTSLSPKSHALSGLPLAACSDLVRVGKRAVASARRILSAAPVARSPAER